MEHCQLSDRRTAWHQLVSTYVLLFFLQLIHQKYNTRGICEMTERRDVMMYHRCHFFLPSLSFRLLPRPAAGTDVAKLSPSRTKMEMVNRGQYSQNLAAFFPSDEDTSMTSKSYPWLAHLFSTKIDKILFLHQVLLMLLVQP